MVAGVVAVEGAAAGGAEVEMEVLVAAVVGAEVAREMVAGVTMTMRLLITAKAMVMTLLNESC